MATALNGEYRGETLQKFLRFRDVRLLSNPLGRFITRIYYFFSPAAARLLVGSPILRSGSRRLFTVIGKFL
ncbi:CFI-box-CTERM domain-containing protein [Mesorhizobium sp. BHbsci]